MLKFGCFAIGFLLCTGYVVLGSGGPLKVMWGLLRSVNCNDHRQKGLSVLGLELEGDRAVA
jgi:hypothetical protein